MGILDDLKKEAEAVKQRQLDETHSRLQQASQNFVLVQSKLTQIFRFLNELTNQLNVLKPTVARSYYLSGFGSLEGMLQSDYAVTTKNFTLDNRDFIKEVHFRFKCATDKTLQVEKETPPVIEQFRDALWRSNIKFECQEFPNARGYVEKALFTLSSSILVNFVISGDHEQGRIKFSARNFAMFGEVEYLFDAEEVNEALLDEFARLILDKSAAFRTQGRHQQAKLEARRAMEETQYRIEDDPSPEAGDNGGNKKLFGSLRSLFGKN